MASAQEVVRETAAPRHTEMSTTRDASHLDGAAADGPAADPDAMVVDEPTEDGPKASVADMSDV